MSWMQKLCFMCGYPIGYPIGYQVKYLISADGMHHVDCTAPREYRIKHGDPFPPLRDGDTLTVVSTVTVPLELHPDLRHETL